MTIGQMFEQSGILTLLGMGTVFSFLVILIICVTLVGKFIHAMGLDKDLQIQAKPKVPAGNPAANATVVSAITAAVTEYRNTH